MIKNKKTLFLHRNKTLLCLALACMTALSAGCGQETMAEGTENVELVEPVGVAYKYEAALKRDLYDSNVYSALVCPYTEEYDLNSAQSFEGFDAFPGEQVKKGATLLHSNTESIDKKIEDKRKEIADMEESYQEFMKEKTEERVEPLREERGYGDIVKAMEAKKPAEKIPVTDPATGAVSQQVNPDYTTWLNEYNQYDMKYRQAYLTVDILDAAIEQRTKLYDLDHAYQLKQLNYLLEDKKDCTLMAGMNGTVAALKYLDNGDWMESDVPMMAVADLDQKLLKSDYINKTVISKAEDVYALINGQRVEIEYREMDADEYMRLSELNDKVYSTFYIKDADVEIQMGDFATIVIINKSVKDVLTVPYDAVKKDDGSNYVYVVENNQSTYTPVKVGMSDGVYTEIVSGIEENTNVLTESVTTTEGETVKLERGGISNTFKSTGYLYYPDSQLVSNPVKYGTSYFLKNEVSLYQQVEKGQTLATIRVVADQVELDRNIRKLAREQARLKELQDDNAEDKNKKAIEAKQKTIKELEKLIADMKKDFTTTEIKAPISGIITAYDNFEEESILQSNRGMYLISSESSSYVFVEDDKGQLTYGNEAAIAYTSQAGVECTAIGQVVTLNQMSLSKALTGDNQMRIGWNSQSSGALVMVSPEDIGNMAGSRQDNEGWWSISSYEVKVKTREMNNVVLIPKKAVKEVQGSTYVKVKEANGEIVNRSFVAGGSNSEYYWVAEGLTEGMEICLK